MKPRRSLLITLCSIFLACTLFLALSFAGEARPVSAQTMAYIRVIHASPDIGTVDVFVDGTKLLSNFQFASVTNYVPLPTGMHKVQIALIGKGISAAVMTQMLSVDTGIAYTVAALGTNATKFSLAIFKDNNSVTGNGAKVRIYHLSPGTGSAHVALNNNTLVTGLSYEQASNYIAVSTGSYTFRVTVAPANITLSTTLKPWTVTSVFAVGELNGSPSFRLISSQEPGIPGMPQTGSDPTPQAGHSQSRNYWPLAFLGLLLLALLALASKNTVRRVVRRWQ